MKILPPTKPLQTQSHILHKRKHELHQVQHIYIKLKHAQHPHSCCFEATNLTGFIFIRKPQVRFRFPYVTAKSGRDFVTRKTSSKTSLSLWESIAFAVSQAQRASLVSHFTAERLNLLNFEWWPFDFCFYNFTSSWYLQVNGRAWNVSKFKMDFV